ncbi:MULTISPECIES: hypothetical protein [unclassified Streptomyces]|uniref:hypothetical protein n=1 Tax=unclassified Streptomyces TaxID=2593676 RepID=UPI002365E60E|nr:MULTISPECIES: hypothetical protein [unclassified Streptomyces]MDF3143962.1 hypothetical protein [Streptomyces sp. T21Q-yed]WDF35710.1 hypothetical protein PBV52_02265 [Streptomyces sp. T12]
MGFELRERWGAQPLWARWVLAVYLIGFTEGTGSHIADLVRGGIHAYASFPQVSLQVFFVSLVILDPLVAVLVGLVRREGIWLASAVMVLDVSANWWGNRHWLRDDPVRLLWLLPITVFGLFVVALAIPLYRAVAGAASRSPAALPSA